MRRGVGMAAGVAAAACGGQAVDSDAPPTVTGLVGQQINLDVRSVMNTGWDSIPQVSPAVLRFISMTQPSALVNPGGPTQRYTFEALAIGRAMVALHRAGTSEVVTFVIAIE
jgi:hypothetical protein